MQPVVRPNRVSEVQEGSVRFSQSQPEKRNRPDVQPIDIGTRRATARLRQNQPRSVRVESPSELIRPSRSQNQRRRKQPKRGFRRQPTNSAQSGRTLGKLCRHSSKWQGARGNAKTKNFQIRRQSNWLNKLGKPNLKRKAQDCQISGDLQLIGKERPLAAERHRTTSSPPRGPCRNLH